MDKNNTHVVIVGIDHYDDRDVTDLRGARNDAKAWWQLCTRYLHVPPEHITVLASPPLTAAELGEGAERARIGGATRTEVIDAMKQLARSVSGGGAAGLVTFSGHGVVAGPKRTGDEGEDLALCPQDLVLDTDRVEQLIRFSRLSKMFADEETDLNVTVILDTCYTATNADTGPERGLLGALRKRGAGRKLFDKLKDSDMGRKLLWYRSARAMSTRLVLAADHWAPAYEICLDGQWRGALSWALCTMMQQWTRKVAGEVLYLNVTHRHLLQRAAMLLGAIGVEQSPTMWGPRRLDNMAVLRPGLDYEPSETSAAPDVPRGGKQVPVDWGHWVTIAFLHRHGDFALVVAVGDTAFSATDSSGQSITYDRNMEYWYANAGSDLSDLSGWSQVSWRCHYSGSYEHAAAEALEAIAQIGCSLNDVAWTASRTSYTWAPGEPRLSYAHQCCFSNGQSGITVGTDSRHKLTGITIYNANNATTWPDSSSTLTMGADVAFSATQSGDMPSYHYIFAT